MDANGFVSGWLAEEPAFLAGRARAAEVGIGAVTPAVGALLRFLAASVDAKTVVETGTGAGVSGLWLLAGMRPGGTLTSVDSEPEHQRLARSTFAEAGIPVARTRLITGNALDVLPRLTDHGYDLVLLDAAPSDYGRQLEQAWRLLRPGGVVAVAGVLRGGRGPDPTARDEESTTLRELLASIRTDPRLRPMLLPLGDGLLVATAPH